MPETLYTKSRICRYTGSTASLLLLGASGGVAGWVTIVILRRTPGRHNSSSQRGLEDRGSALRGALSPPPSDRAGKPHRPVRRCGPSQAFPTPPTKPRPGRLRLRRRREYVALRARRRIPCQSSRLRERSLRRPSLPNEITHRPPAGRNSPEVPDSS